MATENVPPAPANGSDQAAKENTPETRILVVDDVAVDRRKAGGIVEQILGWKVTYADNGRAALNVIERQLPNLVLTDLQMPEMDGLELVEAIRAKYPLLPVVLMTAHGSEDIALQALQRGAASYVPKRGLAGNLASTLDQVMKALRAGTYQQRLLECTTHLDTGFLLENDRDLVPPLLGLLQDVLIGMHLCDEPDRIRVAIALEEALLNALYHGNLGVSSELRQKNDKMYYQLAEQRRRQPPYRDRRLFVNARLTPTEAVYTVRDDGDGFDPRTLPDPTDPANLEKPGGRGLLLIRTFMDDVTYNEKGNQITMVKRSPAFKAATAGPER